MSVIYKPKGKALEYSDLACNLYDGCTHGCTYCYVPNSPVCRTKGISRAEFNASAKPRDNILERLEKDAKKIKGCPTPILFSFTSDAYQPCEKEYQVMRGALEICKMYDLTPNILTKSGTWGIERDIELLKACNSSWGVTLTGCNDFKYFELGASANSERIAALKFAKESGLSTWVSCEPSSGWETVINIRRTFMFTDLYKVGKENCGKEKIGAQYWIDELLQIENELKAHNCKYIIKKSLEAYRR